MPEKTLNELPRELRALHTKGNDALQRENWDYAIALFMQILEKEPYNFDCRRSLKEAQLGKAGAKGGFFKRAFSTASSSPMVAKGQMALRKNPLEAMQIAEGILNSDGNSTGGHKLLAEAALAAEMPKTAVLSYDILYRANPKDKEIGMKLADALAGAGEQTKAERIYEELRGAYPNDNEIFVALKNLSARKTMKEGGYDAAATGQASYRDMLKNKDESVRLEQENRQVKAQDSTQELIKDWETRLEAEPNNMKMLRNLAETYAQRNDFERALGYYERMLAGDGATDASLAKQVSELKVKRFNHDLAQLDPAAPDYNEKSEQITAQRKAFQLDEAKVRAERYPTDLTIRFELGQLYLDAGMVNEAIQEFQKAQQNPHKRIQSMTYLARCFAQRGMNEMAARRLQDALKEKPVFDDEKKELVYLLGTIFEKMGKREDAIKQFESIYEIDIGYKDVQAKVDGFYSGGG